MNDFADGILSEWREPDRRPITKWAASGNVRLPNSKRCKDFREDTAYWINEPINAIQHNECVSICKPTQGSGTTAEEIFLTWLVAQSPQDTHLMAQTDLDAENIFTKKFLRTLKESHATKSLMRAAGRHDITKNRLRLPTMDLAVHGQDLNSMQSDSVEVLILDEAWLYKPGTILEIRERMSAVPEGKRKLVTVSQAGEEILDDFNRPRWDEWGAWWHQGTQEEYGVKCPNCGEHYFPLTSHFSCDHSVARNPETKVWNWAKVRSTAFHVTPCCQHEIPDTDANRRRMSASGQYFQTNFNPQPRHRSFHYSAWIVYWQQWGVLLEQFLRAQDAFHAGDISQLKIFQQKKEARWWTIKDAEIPVINTKLASGYRTDDFKPTAGQQAPRIDLEERRFMFVDMQRDRFPIMIRAFRHNGSRMLFCDEVQHIESVQEISNQYGLQSGLVGLDVNNWTSDGLEFCFRNKWTPMRGRDVRNFTRVVGRANGALKRPYQAVMERLTGKAIYGIGKTLKVWEFGNTFFKDLFSRLRAMPEHEIPDDVPQLYVESMESEAKDPGGLWRQIGKRPNHFWDCEVGITFMAFLYKLVGSPEEQEASAE